MILTEEHPPSTNRILVDVSPIFYSNLISVTSQMKRSGLKPDSNNKIPFTYKSELIFAVFEEIKNLKGVFNTSEVILAFDNSEGGYWRKQSYDRYKYKRTKARDDSEIEWDKAFEAFNEIKTVLKEFTSFGCLDIPHVEADDACFVLGDYFQDKGGVTMVSLDGDWRLSLVYDNVRLYKTRKTQRKAGVYEILSPEEIQEKRDTMAIAGDPKDGMLHIKSWSKFSSEFLKEYPKFEGRELEMYPHHHQIEHKFNLKHDFNSKIQAYKHPRFGYKSFQKTKTKLSDLLQENPIYKMNYNRNKELCLPEFIPEHLRVEIISTYETAKTDHNPGELQKFFIKNNLFELTGIISQL